MYEKCHNFNVPNNRDLADCFFFHDELIIYDITNSILDFYAGIEEKDILFFFLRNFKFIALISLEQLCRFC